MAAWTLAGIQFQIRYLTSHIGLIKSIRGHLPYQIPLPSVALARVGKMPVTASIQYLNFFFGFDML